MNKQMVMYSILILILSSVMVFAQNLGSKDIILKGGKKGNITFPH